MSEQAPGQIRLFPPTDPPSEVPLHPRTGKPLDADTIRCKQNNRHHLEPCPFEGCSGILENKGAIGSKHRYACDTPFPGATRKHWAYYRNDEVWLEPKRDHNRNHKIPGLACPYCGSEEYDYGTASKDGRIQKYWCRNPKCSETFIVEPSTDGQHVVRQRAKSESDNTNPQCPNCNSRRNVPQRRTPRRVSALEIVDDRICKECGHSWEQVYDLRRSPDDVPMRACAYCGGPIKDRGKRARFCSDAHQRYAQEMERRKRRKREEAAQKKKVGG